MKSNEYSVIFYDNPFEVHKINNVLMILEAENRNLNELNDTNVTQNLRFDSFSVY